MFMPFVIALAVDHGAASGNVNFRGTGQLQRSQVTDEVMRELTFSDAALAEYEEGLRHMFVSLPKNKLGRLGHQAVRTAMHRFFVNRHGWWLRGFELTSSPDEDSSAALDKDRVPEFLQETFEKANLDHGADLHDLAALAASVEQLVEKETRAHLTDCYEAVQVPQQGAVERSVARAVIHTYFMSFILEHNWTVDGRDDLKNKTHVFAARYPLYKNATDWLFSVFNREMGQATQADFNQTLKVANTMGQEYHDLNDAECTELSSTLQKMESRKAGRVRLSVFYNMSIHSHWRFTEKVQTLRNLGALDDADPKNMYVIIPNYAMARPNCVNASNVFEICCPNTCEVIQSHLEREVSGATATPDHIEQLVANLASDGSTVSYPRTLSEPLIQRLNQVADHHQGLVPLHGRLFKQWLHHAYPLVCPYPHEAGTTNPKAWTGEDSDQATDDEIMQHVQADTCAVNPEGRIDCGEESTELPWSTAEELLVSGPVHHGRLSSSVADEFAVVIGLGLMAASVVAFAVVHSLRSSRADQRRALAVPGALALAGLASCIGLLDPTIAVIGAVGGVAANFAAQRTRACQSSKLPTSVKGL